MATETYLGDEILYVIRRYRDDLGDLHWTVEGTFTTYDEADDALFGTWRVEDYYVITDPGDQAGMDAFGGLFADAMAASLDVDAEKLSAPGSPGTPPLTRTEDYLGDDLYVTLKRYRDTGGDDALHWTSFGNGTTYDDETDARVAPRYLDDLFLLLDGSTQAALDVLGDNIAGLLATARGGVATENPSP